MRPKHDPTDSYFYIPRELAKCMMRSDALNSHIYPIGTDMTATKQIQTSHVCSMDDSELKEFLVEKTLSLIYSMDRYESKIYHH